MKFKFNVPTVSGVGLAVALCSQSWTQECVDWSTTHPEWIFCEDFETTGPLVGPRRFFEHTDNAGDFIPMDTVGTEGSRGMRVLFQQDEVDAGSLKLAFGRTPQAYMDKGIRNTEDFRDIYYRMYLKMQSGWTGSPAKLSRATVFNSDTVWSQAMIAHLWSGSREELLLDPASCVDGNNQVRCTTYNDFDQLDWLGISRGGTRLFSRENSDRWFCVEHHVRLNDPGESNGLQEFWIDDSLEARAADLNFVGSWTQYGLNAVFFENYWNDGSLQEQERYFDNIVVSTERIGCLENPIGVREKPGSNFRDRTGSHWFFVNGGALRLNVPDFIPAGQPRQFLRISIKSISGREVYSWESSRENLREIEIQGLRSGIYFPEVTLVR